MKKSVNRCLEGIEWQKLSRIMKLSMILFFVGIMQISAATVYSQEATVTIKSNDLNLEEVLQEIENQADIRFFYKNEQVDIDTNMDIDVENMEVEEVLSYLFDDSSTSYKYFNNDLVLLSKREANSNNPADSQQSKVISGTVLDERGDPISNATVMVKGTTIGALCDNDGNYSIKVTKSNPTLLFSFIGYKDKEVSVDGKSSINVTLEESITDLDQVVVVGYGTQKKVHLTGSVTQIESDVVEDRAIANASQALQGAVPNLEVSNTSYGGEPGAAMDLNIRGILTVNSDGDVEAASPLVLVDGVEMDMNNVDPEDIKTVSVLKDASAAAVYGSRAAGGVILITTKSGKSMNGKMRVAYSNNMSWATPTAWPTQATALEFANVMNDAATNNGSNPYYTEEELGWITMNMEEAGSAPTLQVKSDGKNWDQSNVGLGATASTDWKDFFLKDWAARQKHNLRFSGGDQKLNYYASAGYYKEDGLNAQADEFYKRANLDIKLNSQPHKWLNFSLLTKFIKNTEKHPWDYNYGRGRVFDLMSKVKPTLPIVDPIFGEPLIQAYYPLWSTQWEDYEKNQIMLLPRVVIEPIEDWKINIEYNYKRDNNQRTYTALQYEYHFADGSTGTVPTSDLTQVRSTLSTTEYFSPNIYTSYNKSYKDHNFKILAGYQNELTEYYAMVGKGYTLLTDNIPSISTSVGEQTVDDGISHYSTQSIFARFNYDYKGKYLLEASYRRDGSSKFEEGSRYAGFPSFSAGYNIAKEDFWWFKEDIQTFKLRASYGTLGNQNVANYKYLSVMDVKTGSYLFDGSWDYYVDTPDLLSSELSWEVVKTTDFGLDFTALDGKLSGTFDWYRSDISGMSTTGETLPAVLGTDEPSQNAGIMRTQGWESEFKWKDKIGQVSYNARFVLSDYQKSVVEYPNPTKLYSDYYDGKDMGEIIGLEWDGWFQTQDEIDNYEIDQSAITAWSITPGDTRYVNQNGDNVIDKGTSTVGDSGDLVVIGNTTPRYQYGLNLGANWKGIDFSLFLQGVGKRDFYMGDAPYRGPANGPYHANVYEFHLDYWRDDTSALGENRDAHWAKPYAANPGRNNKNYNQKVDRYVADASYLRLKSLQIGYTVPKHITDNLNISNIRVFATGENLWTKTSFPMYDPESIKGNFGNAIAYPLSKVISAGINVSL